VIHVPNLPVIQQELLQMFYQLCDPVPTGSAFISMYNSDLQWQSLIHLNQWLTNLGLADRRIHCYYSVLNNASVMPIHVDYTNEEKFLAVNIPLLNCDGSYITWYNADIDPQMQIKETKNQSGPKRLLIYDESGEDYVTGNTSYWCMQEGAKQVQSVETTAPMLVNVSIPHRPEVKHDRLRVLFSLRFIFPELTMQEQLRFNAKPK
jgi:hypothetical protein